MIRNVDNVGVAVRDLRTALDFYNKLGFVIEYADAAGASIRAGDAVLYVFQTTSHRAPVTRGLDLEQNAPGIDHISFAVDDVDAAARELRSRGLEVESGPTDQDWGRRTITLLDPEGNRIWLLGPLTGT
jgi:catechol 2,3-dioxygenase-like lactoylglutathione lyase family enzyme